MADNNIIIKITSEADLTAAQQQIKELTERAEQQTQALKDLSREEKEDAEAIKGLGLSAAKLKQRLAENAKYYEDLRKQKKADIAETKQSIKANNDSIKSYKVMTGQSGRMVMQLRAMREELQRMEEGGEFGSEAFINLSIAAGQLSDQIGDTQQRISVLASDTKNMDAVLGLGDGLAGVFSVATSASEVFGDDMEGLEKAFYKVQAAISVVSGVQQVANALNKDSAAMVVLNTALTQLFAKIKKKSAVSTAVDAAASTADTAAKTGEAAATTAATVAQKGLNAAIKSNPIGMILGIILTAVAAIAALGVGIAKLVHHFSEAGKAEEAYAEASAHVEEVQAENAKGAAKRAYDRQQQIKATSDAEEKALKDAEERGASELELAQIKEKYAKQAETEAKRYTAAEIARNKQEVAALKTAMEAKQRQVNAYKKGSDKQKEAQEELNEIESNYYEALQKTKDLEEESAEAMKKSEEAAKALKEAREDLVKQTKQANIDLMKDGAAKEIAQIKLNYEEQMKEIQGSSEEEIALRKALEKKKAKEIAEVRKKYADEEKEKEKEKAESLRNAAIQEKKNLLEVLSKSEGTEADYTKELTLRKQIANMEAQAEIDALDKARMSQEEYTAKAEAIRLELANTIREIDESEAERLAENAKRLTEIELQEAEARKNALSGDDDIATRKAVITDYYAALRKQIKENAEYERKEISRSTDTVEVKAAKLKKVDSKLNADIQENTKETAEEIANIYDEAIQQIKDHAESGMSKAVFGDGTSIKALQENRDKQLAIYDEMKEALEELHSQGLIETKDYEKQLTEIEMAETDVRVAYQKEAMKTISSGFSAVAEHVQQMSDLIFGAIVDNIQAQIDALDEMYTTDADEAKESNEKKYISEKELEEKKAKLTLRQQKLNKANAILQIGLDTAMAIMSIWAEVPKVDFGASAIALTAMTSVLGATQLAIAAAKPLSQYAKGRKGGEGEFALVGEKGPEVMYVPKGASIVPNNKLNNPEKWGEYGIPQLAIPATANVSADALDNAITATTWQPIDYDRLGAAVAKAMPKQRTVNVNVDRSGVMVQSGSNRRTYLNTKYYAQW